MLIKTKRLYQFIILSLLFFTFGAAVLILIYNSFPSLMDHSEYKWEKTIGRIEMIKRYPVICGNSSDETKLFFEIEYRSKIKYSYRVNGKCYYSWANDESSTENFAVYYNPKNPRESTLEPKPKCKPLLGIVLTISFLTLYLKLIKSKFIWRLSYKTKSKRKYQEK